VTLGLYAYALRAARPRQLARRATRPVRRRLFPAAAGGAAPHVLEANGALWRSDAFGVAESSPSGELARFHENYGGDVLTLARAADAGGAAALIRAWIDGSPPRPGAPWHPYVISTRLGNWVAALTLEPSLATPSMGESMRRQLAHLARNIEDDILGNHVIRNARALILAGRSLGEEHAVELGRRLLRRELPEQVLADGGHYERSPAYHRLVLRDLLELEPFADVAEPVARMRTFAAASSRPDGAPALFNDGGLDLAPRLELAPPPDGLRVFADTGYAFLRRREVWLAFDCGAPAPAFLPAHAHADALSFQLWFGGRPQVVDAGTSTYEPGPVRRRERGTEAHSTIAVGGDQFVVWGSFRSGPLPRVRLLDAAAETLVGEATLPGGTRIVRTLRIDSSSLLVEDRVDGSGVHDLVSSVPLASGASVRVIPLTGDAELEQRTVAEQFGAPTPSTAVVQRLRTALPWEGGWRVEWGGA
jgi:hypothetical protein